MRLWPQPDGWLAAVVMMSPPQGMTEAYFVALFYQERTRTTRVFTLEKGVSLDPAATPLTVFCEWTADNVHCNMGPVPEPDAGLFLDAAAVYIHLVSLEERGDLVVSRQMAKDVWCYSGKTRVAC